VSTDSRSLVGSPPGTARMSVVQDSEVSGQHTCRPYSAGADGRRLLLLCLLRPAVLHVFPLRGSESEVYSEQPRLMKRSRRERKCQEMAVTATTGELGAAYAMFEAAIK
jgi:hypothetical protein